MERSTLVAADGVVLLRRTFAPKQRARAAIAAHHGLGDHGAFYEGLGEAMAQRGFALSLHDARGHGKSPGQRGHVDSWDDLRNDFGLEIETLRAENPAAPLFLLGNSLGGLVVLDYVRRQPGGIAGVIALSPAVGATGVPAWVTQLGRLLSRVWPRFSLDARLDRNNLSRDPAAVRRFDEDPLYHTRGSARLSTEFERTLRELRRHASELETPLLILHGRADRIVPAEASRSLFERIGSDDKARKEYPGGFHNLLHDTNRDEVMADLARWIDARIEPPAASD